MIFIGITIFGCATKTTPISEDNYLLISRTNFTDRTKDNVKETIGRPTQKVKSRKKEFWFYLVSTGTAIIDNNYYYLAFTDIQKGKVYETGTALVCPKCKTTGKIKCNKCSGKGKKKQVKYCSNCGGSGEVRTRRIERRSGRIWASLGYENCTECNGKGYTSERWQKCYNCDGKGELKCEKCNGIGYTLNPQKLPKAP